MTYAVGAFIGFVALPAALVVAERLWPSVVGQPLLRPGAASDAVWYFVESYVARAIAPWATYFALVPLIRLSGMSASEFYSGFGPVSAIPFWWQVPIVFVLADFLSYWQHRLFHRQPLWPLHAVHHSSTQLDWLSSGRFHPLNEIGAQLVYVAPLIACGFNPFTFLALAPFTTWYVVVLHGNLGWTLGPLRRVVASPVFHRWHHTCEDEACHRNFGGILAIWDVLFGTFHMPAGRVPTRFGTSDPVPDGFLRQLCYPLWRARGASR